MDVEESVTVLERWSMVAKKLDILKFSTVRNREYIYDNVSGMVIPCTPESHDVIENYFQKPQTVLTADLCARHGITKTDAEACYKHVEIMIQNGFFYKTSTSPTKNEISEDDLLNTQVSSLTLIVTEECNLRCKYCVYSEEYPHFKSYSKQRMAAETAIQAVDYYMELHQERQVRGLVKDPAINFYGGEPLLEFELIQKVIEHCNDQGYKANYYITTNGTIMTDEIIDFIIRNDVLLTVSLDGDQYEHDRKRVFKNQKGTFEVILKNIARLQAARKEQDRIQGLNFNCCFDSYTDMCRVAEFFQENEELFSPFSVLWNKIASFGTTYYDHLEDMRKAGLLEGNKDNLFRSLSKLGTEYHENMIEEKDTARCLDSLFFGLALCKNRPKGIELPVFKNACEPGCKLAVDAEGLFYVCERANQQHSIGSIEEKLDLGKINDLLGEFLKLWNEHCESCNINKLCELCYVHFLQDNKLVFNHEICAERRESVPIMLGNLYSTLEDNPNAFDRLLEALDVGDYDVLVK